MIAAPAVGAGPSSSHVPAKAPSKRALKKCLALVRFIRVDTSATSVANTNSAYPDAATGQAPLDDRSRRALRQRPDSPRRSTCAVAPGSERALVAQHPELASTG